MIAGKIFFWSTLGSIVGSLSAGFLLIPHLGISQIMIAVGIVLFFLGFFGLLGSGWSKRNLLCLFVFATLAFVRSFYELQQKEPQVIFAKDGIYEKIRIWEGSYDDHPTRFLRQDRTSSAAMFLDTEDPRDLVYDYTKYHFLYKVLNPQLKDILFIGGGAYTMPKAMLKELPNSDISVCEIEPCLIELGKKYFRLPDTPRLHHYLEDGRRHLSTSEKKYDMIFSDVYYSLESVPAHFTSQEFFQLAKSRLQKNGIFLGNFIGDLSHQPESLILTEIKTFQTVFSNSYFFAVEYPAENISQNIIFVGYNSDKKLDVTSISTQQELLEITSNLPEKLVNVHELNLDQYPVLTDNYCPVEYMTAKSLHRNWDE
jgi:spermidine synthase